MDGRIGLEVSHDPRVLPFYAVLFRAGVVSAQGSRNWSRTKTLPCIRRLLSAHEPISHLFILFRALGTELGSMSFEVQEQILAVVRVKGHGA